MLFQLRTASNVYADAGVIEKLKIFGFLFRPIAGSPDQQEVFDDQRVLSTDLDGLNAIVDLAAEFDALAISVEDGVRVLTIIADGDLYSPDVKRCQRETEAAEATDDRSTDT